MEELERMQDMQVHTDLALEARESVTEGQEGIPGVSIEEEFHKDSGVRVTRVEVLSVGEHVGKGEAAAMYKEL